MTNIEIFSCFLLCTVAEGFFVFLSNFIHNSSKFHCFAASSGHFQHPILVPQKVVPTLSTLGFEVGVFAEDSELRSLINGSQIQSCSEWGFLLILSRSLQTDLGAFSGKLLASNSYTTGLATSSPSSAEKSKENTRREAIESHGNLESFALLSQAPLEKK